MGLTIWSYRIRWGARDGDRVEQAGWRDALDVLDHCRELGAGCLQIGVRGWTEDFAGRVRERRESLGIALEGQIGLPRRDEDLPRFEAEIRAAREAGATVLRTVCLGGRRYETFRTLEDWQRFVRESRAAVERAEPVAARHGVRLAVENHKDWRIAEFLDLLGHIDSEWVGVNLDFGNNFALLEHPHEVARALAPWVRSTHVKDMALAPGERGFLLSEVPLGEGALDLGAMMNLCAEANPDVWFNLEMITRDPLVIPFLEDDYWASLPHVPASDLARVLRVVRKGEAESLPRAGERNFQEQLAWEEDNVRRSFAHAREKLGFE